MITFLTTAAHDYTVKRWLASFGTAYASRVRVGHIEALARRMKLPGGAWVFTDLERLGRGQRELLAQMWSQLEGHPSFRLINHPTRTVLRAELLRGRFNRGENTFDARRFTDPQRPTRFPQFVRAASDHNGPRSAVLHSPQEVEDAAIHLCLLGFPPEDVLIVEYLSMADENGIYRKYSVFNVNGRLVPRHVLFSRDWVQKFPDLADPPLAAEELVYLHSNPHRDEIAAIFASAGIGWGRIDYGIKDGRLQVWEINTNPMMMMARDQYPASRLDAQDWFGLHIGEAIGALDAGLAPGSAKVVLTR